MFLVILLQEGFEVYLCLNQIPIDVMDTEFLLQIRDRATAARSRAGLLQQAI